MPKRLTIEEIQKYIEEKDVDNGCILLSTEYVNGRTPLKFYCNYCGSIYEKDWEHFKKRGVFCCQKCSRKRAGQKRAISIEQIKQFIEENDTEHLCTLLSTEYINNETPLHFRCNKCGQEFDRDWAHLRRGRFQCPDCGIHQGATYQKYTKEMVMEDIAKRGYTMVGEYVNAGTPFDAVCKRGHSVKLIYTHFKNKHSGCPLCAGIDNSGPNHWNWKGGESLIRDYLRHSIKNWKRDVLIKDGFKCVLSGEQNHDLVIHHLISFNTLVQQASEMTGIPVLQNFSDYENEEYIILRDALISLHKPENGVTLTRPIHNLFHDLYGRGNNTIEQFQEFSRRYQAGEFEVNGENGL